MPAFLAKVWSPSAMRMSRNEASAGFDGASSRALRKNDPVPLRAAGVGFAFARAHAPAKPSEASFLDIRIADGDRDFAAQAGIRPGVRVRLLGFVVGSKDVPSGTFELARFYIACCIADAEAVGVPVGGRGYKPNTWLEVTGSLAKRGKRFVVVPDKVIRVRAPEQPYLSFQT